MLVVEAPYKILQMGAQKKQRRKRKVGNRRQSKEQHLHAFLKKQYYNPKEPGSYGGVTRLLKATREKFQNLPSKKKRVVVKRKEVEKWLEGEEAYTLHRPVRRKFPRNRVYVTYKDQQFEADLVDMSHLNKYNDGYRYLLTCIDVLSKYAWVVPLKNKSGEDVAKAFQSILTSSGRYCQKLHTDEGKEFYNSKFRAMLKLYDIEHFSSGNKEIKCSVVERFNRTVKTRMYRYLTAKSTNRYIDVLQDLVRSYNLSVHSSIGMAPADVTDQNQKKVWEKLYGGHYPTSDSFQLQVGDQVRIPRAKGRFEQGFLQNWSDEVFIVVQCVGRVPPVYKLKDVAGETLDGTFYSWELQRVIKPMDTYFKIEKIIDQKTEGRKKFYLVKYKGYPEKFNAWVPAKDIKKL